MKISTKLTPKQNIMLESAGFNTLYDFITYLPFDLQILAEFSPQSESGVTSILEGTVSDYAIGAGRRSMTKINILSKYGVVQCYSFVPYRFIHSLLNSGERLFFAIKRSGDFWTVQSITKKNPFQDGEKILLPKYIAKGLLNSRIIRSIHSRLDHSYYILNLQGLLPTGLHQTKGLSLEYIHKPVSVSRYHQTFSEWTAVQAFLQLMELKYFSTQIKKGSAKASHITEDIKNKVLNSHPYKLSQTQTHAIEFLIRKMTK